MMPLTPAITLFNTATSAAKSADWVDSQFEQRAGVQAPSNPSVLFFVLAPEGFLYGGVHGETFGFAGLVACDVRRSVNPVYAVTILIDSEWCRFGLNQIENIAMSAKSILPPGTPEECYTVTSAVFVGKPVPLDAITVAANRSSSMVRMMMTSLEADDQPATHHDLMNCLWQLEAMLGQIPEIVDAWLGSQKGEVKL